MLGEVTFWDKRFQGVPALLQSKILKFKHVSSEKLKSLKSDSGNIKLLSTGNFEGFTTENLGGNYINDSEVIAIPTGGTANLKYYNGKFIDSGNLLGISADFKLYNIKYIYYFMLNINNIIQEHFRGSGVKHPNMLEILKLQIPIPPLPVQLEIVRILDNFTELTAELTAEIEMRTKQYEYYRNKLLSFPKIEVEV
jgi:type I restriction enzyme S subunit